MQLIPNAANVAAKSWSAWLMVISGALILIGNTMPAPDLPGWRWAPLVTLAVGYAARFIAQKGKGFTIPDASDDAMDQVQ